MFKEINSGGEGRRCHADANPGLFRGARDQP